VSAIATNVLAHSALVGRNESARFTSSAAAAVSRPAGEDTAAVTAEARRIDAPGAARTTEVWCTRLRGLETTQASVVRDAKEAHAVEPIFAKTRRRVNG